MMLHFLFLFSTMLGGSFQDVITPTSNTVHALEGNDIVLSCSYSVGGGYSSRLQWYRQYPRSKPQFLDHALERSQTVLKAESPQPRLSGNHDKNNKLVHLEISSAEVTD
ncbi:hypothetical protein COCON_G00091430, partial [Conger conger]